MAKKKAMFPANSIPASKLFNEGSIRVNVYNTNPRMEIIVHSKISDEVQRDLIQAIDNVLKHHGL